MKASEFMTKLSADIESWVKSRGGSFIAARDPLHPYVVLAGGTYQSFVVILSYAGGSALNTDQQPHSMKSAKVEIFVGYGMDLRADPSAWLFKDDGSKPSILKTLDDLVAHVLTVVFDNGEGHDDAYAEYGGDEQASLPDGAPLKAFKATVSWPLPITIDQSQYRYLN
jgi:hypothetical protein